MSFTRVTKQAPCPVCKHGDWCRVFADGWAECMRVQSDRPAKSGGWMHRLGEAPRRYSPPPAKAQAPTINATKMMREWLAATSPSALERFAGEVGLAVRSLSAVGAAWSAAHAAWAFPMCDGYGNVVGIRLRNERGKFAVRGSRQGIFVCTCDLTAPDAPAQPAGIGRLGGSQTVANQRSEVVQPYDSVGLKSAATANGSQSRTLFVCEGPTDTAAAAELGLFAVGRPNCCCGGPEIRIYARRQAVARVVVVADNDKPGLDGARKVGAELRLPFAIYVPPAKDVREFVRLGGTRAMIESALKATVWNP